MSRYLLSSLSFTILDIWRFVCPRLHLMEHCGTAADALEAWVSLSQGMKHEGEARACDFT